MAAVVSLLPLTSAVNLTSTTAVAIAAFNAAFTASQIGVLGLRLRIDLPAGGGGIKLNWRLPGTNWPFGGEVMPWAYEIVGGDGTRILLGTVPLADPVRDNYVVIPSTAVAQSIYLSAKHAFKAPAGGGTLQLFAGLFSISGQNTVLPVDTTNGIASYVESTIQ